MTQRRLLIVAHAPSDNTRRLLDAVVEGARSDENQNVEVVALSPFDAGPEDVLAARAIILGT
ncbi:MAG: flavodoxin family protein, partial [Planctomycetota bacterium]|nr:flavodoxin family protein [Planctomycetota bacterium]